MSVLAPAQDDRIFDAAKVARKLNENHWMSCVFPWNVHLIWYTRWTWLIIHALVVNFSWRVFCVSIRSLWLCIKVLQREYCTLLITWLKHHPLFLKIRVVQPITSLSTFVVYFIAYNFQSINTISSIEKLQILPSRSKWRTFPLTGLSRRHISASMIYP